MNEYNLKEELLCGIMKLPPKKRDEFWDTLVALGFIKEDENE